MRKDGVNLQRNTRGQFAAKCGGQIARNIQNETNLSSGIYLVKVCVGNQIQTQKLVVE